MSRPRPGSESAKRLRRAPRLALTRQEAAAALGMSINSFERHVQPELRLVRRGKLRLPGRASHRPVRPHAPAASGRAPACPRPARRALLWPQGRQAVLQSGGQPARRADLASRRPRADRPPRLSPYLRFADDRRRRERQGALDLHGPRLDHDDARPIRASVPRLSGRGSGPPRRLSRAGYDGNVTMSVLQGCCKVLHEHGAERVQRGPTGVEPLGHLGLAKSLQINVIPGPKAEGEGFEPSVDRKAHNGFRGRSV
jgi:hypothetical protein